MMLRCSTLLRTLAVFAAMVGGSGCADDVESAESQDGEEYAPLGTSTNALEMTLKVIKCEATVIKPEGRDSFSDIRCEFTADSDAPYYDAALYEAVDISLYGKTRTGVSGRDVTAFVTSDDNFTSGRDNFMSGRDNKSEADFDFAITIEPSDDKDTSKVHEQFTAEVALHHGDVLYEQGDYSGVMLRTGAPSPSPRMINTLRTVSLRQDSDGSDEALEVSALQPVNAHSSFRYVEQDALQEHALTFRVFRPQRRVEEEPVFKALQVKAQQEFVERFETELGFAASIGDYFDDEGLPHLENAVHHTTGGEFVSTFSVVEETYQELASSATFHWRGETRNVFLRTGEMLRLMLLDFVPMLERHMWKIPRVIPPQVDSGHRMELEQTVTEHDDEVVAPVQTP